MDKQLIHKRENLLFGVLLVISILTTIVLLFSIIGIMILGIFLLLSIFSNGISNAYIRINGVQLTEKQFPDLHKKVMELCKKMGVWDVPEVYIMESGGMLNAFATKASAIFGKNMVILYSDIVEMDYEDMPFDINFIIAHELAHIQRSHIMRNICILPATWIPFVGSAYSRSCEYTCDRMAAYYTEDTENAINSMIVLASGKKLFSQVNVEAYLEQYNSKRGFFTALTELLSTHPALPKRIEAMQQLMYGDSSVKLVSRRGIKLAIMAILGCSVIFMITVPVVMANTILPALERFLELEEDNPLFEEYDFSKDPNGGLMEAILDGDEVKVEQYLADGIDPNMINTYGDSLLTLATHTMSFSTIPILLEYGADPNMVDANDWNPITAAVFTQNINLCKLLLHAGADPYAKDENDLSAVDYAKDLEFARFLNLINE